MYSPLSLVTKLHSTNRIKILFNLTNYSSFSLFICAGTLLSQKSLVQALDEVQYKSRVIFEKYAMHTVWPTFKMIFAVILFWIDAFARYTKINVIFEVSRNSYSN